MAQGLVTKTGEAIAKGRIRPALATAIRLIIEDGLSQADAAKRVEMRQESLSVALRKPHVKAFRDAVKRAWLASETDKAWLTVTGLATGAASEDVRLKAAKVLLDAAGELSGGKGQGDSGPRTMVQIVMHHPDASQQPTPQQLPGVIEGQAVRVIRHHSSNSDHVGRDQDDSE